MTFKLPSMYLSGGKNAFDKDYVNIIQIMTDHKGDR